MAEYDDIAPYYDVLHANRKQTAQYVKRLIKEFAPQAKTLLGLACGTGGLLKLFSRQYRVSGLDISSGMLDVARKKLPKATFHQDDMCQFELQQSFDVVTCLYCSLNHVLNFDDWCAMFAKAKAHLNPGGVFIFDVMTETGLYNMVLNSPLVVKRFNQISIGEISMSEEGDYSLWRARGYRRFFKRDESLYDVCVKQTAFAIERLLAVLHSHFSEVFMEDPECNEVVGERSELVYFICK